MSQTERDNIIKQGVQIRRNTYRGKDITNYYKDGTLFSMIKSGKFDDIYVGDYIVSENTDESSGKIIWLIADLDNYWNQGDKPLLEHHATIIPSYKLEDDRMNPKTEDGKGTTEGGYMGSEMYQVTLGKIYNQYIAPDFCKDTSNCHIIKYRNLVVNEVKSDLISSQGRNNGASSNWVWADRQLDLMSEVNVYGTIIWSSSGYDIGADNRQYAIFQLRPELINQGISEISDTNSGRYLYWLKGVNYSQSFTIVSSDGDAGGGFAYATDIGVRPRFLID